MKPEEVQTSGNHREVPVSMKGKLMTGGQGAFAEAFRESGLPEMLGPRGESLELSRSFYTS